MNVIFALIGNFLKWMIPGVFVLIYCLVLALVFSEGGPPHADKEEAKFTSKLPTGMLSFMGVSCLLIALTLFLLIMLNPNMDVESLITFIAFGCVALIFGISWTRKELKRISIKLGTKVDTEKTE